MPPLLLLPVAGLVCTIFKGGRFGDRIIGTLSGHWGGEKVGGGAGGYHQRFQLLLS